MFPQVKYYLFLTVFLPTFILFSIEPRPKCNADVIKFSELPTPVSGYNNGDTSLAETHREPFTVTGQGENAYGDFETNQYFASGNTQFGNQYATGSFNGQSYDYWNGWSWTNIVDTTDGTYLNQYAAWTGGGSNGQGGIDPGSNYAIGFGDGAWITLDSDRPLKSIEITNTTYTARTILEGINGGKKFGGESGTDPDYFSVTIHGFDGTETSANELIARTVFLADYRFDDSNDDFVLSQWTPIDLSDFTDVKQLRLSFDGSDLSPFGLNTPTYLAIDNLTYVSVPEPNMFVASLMATLAAALMTRRRIFGPA